MFISEFSKQPNFLFINLNYTLYIIIIINNIYNIKYSKEFLHLYIYFLYTYTYT